MGTAVNSSSIRDSLLAAKVRLALATVETSIHTNSLSVAGISKRRHTSQVFSYPADNFRRLVDHC